VRALSHNTRLIFIIIIFLFALQSIPMLSAAPAVASSRLAQVTVKDSSGQLVIGIVSTGQIRVRLTEISTPAPPRVIIDLLDTVVDAGFRRAIEVNKGNVLRVRFGQFQDRPAIARIVLDLVRPVRVAVKRTAPNILTVIVPMQLVTAAQPKDAPSAPVTAAQPKSAASAPAQSKPPVMPAVSPTSVPGIGTPNVSQAKTAYILGPGDVLEVSVWGYADLTRVAAIRPDGKISLPLVGSMKAAGMSVEMLTKLLVKAYAEYIISPQVTVIVKEFRKIQVSVLGQVARPGTYTLSPGARLLDLISAAGGTTDVAQKEAELLRPGEPPVNVDLDELLAGVQEINFELKGGETLVVPEDLVNIVNVAGEVVRPGRYRLKGQMRVIDALLLAGGLTEKASVTHASLVRSSRETLPLHLDALLLRQEMSRNIPLQAGDILMIPEEVNNKIYVVGDVNNPGAHPVKADVTLLQAIAIAGGPVQRGPGTARVVHVLRRNGGVPGPTVPAVSVEALPNGAALLTVDLQALLRSADAMQNLAVQPGDVVVVPQTTLGGLQVFLSILSGIFRFFR